MFPIDPALLPTLKTRRALIVVDPQNDFLAHDGAVFSHRPEDLSARMAALVDGFRKAGGVIIWTCSELQDFRPIPNGQILTSDEPTSDHDVATAASGASPSQERLPDAEFSPCPEAFLTAGPPQKPRCVLKGSAGAAIHADLQAVAKPKDPKVIKTHYSAFDSEQLLQTMRMRLVTELFVCGSLTNVGVMATAMDAASHGYSITIVEDCCGHRSEERHSHALDAIAEATGCGILQAAEVLDTSTAGQGPDGKPTVRERSSGSSSSGLSSALNRMSLAGKSAANEPRG